MPAGRLAPASRTLHAATRFGWATLLSCCRSWLAPACLQDLSTGQRVFLDPRFNVSYNPSGLPDVGVAPWLQAQAQAQVRRQASTRADCGSLPLRCCVSGPAQATAQGGLLWQAAGSLAPAPRPRPPTVSPGALLRTAAALPLPVHVHVGAQQQPAGPAGGAAGLPALCHSWLQRTGGAALQCASAARGQAAMQARAPGEERLTPCAAAGLLMLAGCLLCCSCAAWPPRGTAAGLSVLRAPLLASTNTCLPCCCSRWACRPPATWTAVAAAATPATATAAGAAAARARTGRALRKARWGCCGMWVVGALLLGLRVAATAKEWHGIEAAQAGWKQEAARRAQLNTNSAAPCRAPMARARATARMATARTATAPAAAPAAAAGRTAPARAVAPTSRRQRPRCTVGPTTLLRRAAMHTRTRTPMVRT